MNPMHMTDFYKTGHKKQYPDNISFMYSNFTPRSNRLAGEISKYIDGKIVVAGLQGLIQWFLVDEFNNNFFNQPIDKVVAKYKRRMDKALGVDAVSTQHIEALHALGYLPLTICALSEGTVTDAKVPHFTINSTHEDFAWLVNYLETPISSEVWKPSTTATTAHAFRVMLEYYAISTGSPVDFVRFQGHDFSFRGMSGMHDAMHCGAAHLYSFYGTDTIPALDYLEDYYSGCDSAIVGCSVPATEHSVASSQIAMYERKIREMAYMPIEDDVVKGMAERMFLEELITKRYPSGYISYVADTYDFFRLINEIAPSLKSEIMNRIPDANGAAKVVFRPDSGNPADILCGSVDVIAMPVGTTMTEMQMWAVDVLREIVGDETAHGERGASEITGHFSNDAKIYEIKVEIEWNRRDKRYYYIDGASIMSCEEVTLSPEQLGAVEVLWNHFGGTINDKGFKVLHERVGLIYGDSITFERGVEIMERLMKKGFASCNVVLGIGLK